MHLDFGEVAEVRGRGEKGPRSLELAFGTQDDEHVKVMRSIVWDEEGERLVARFRQGSGKFRVTSPFLPESTSLGRPYKEVTELRRDMIGEEPHGFLFSGTGGLMMPRAWREDNERWSKAREWYSAASNLWDVYFDLNRHVERRLMEIAYIGPLRSSPQRTYQVSAEPPADVGRDGEYATEVLYQSSRTDNRVLDATNEWLGRLGYGELGFEPAGDFYRVFVCQEDSDLEVNLADCGMGLSQLLPLLVQGCVLPVGGTLIAQQPEIHLNPAQQDVMTDFLISLCESGRRVIVETHSEHILGRLRRRIAEGESIESDEVAIYFCDTKDRHALLDRIPVGEFGEIAQKDWPTGFFNEQLTNSLELARAQSRRRRAVHNG